VSGEDEHEDEDDADDADDDDDDDEVDDECVVVAANTVVALARC